MGVWYYVTLVLRIAAAAFAGLVALGAGLRALGLFPATPSLDTWVWVVALVIIGVDNVATLFTRSARRKKAALTSDIRKALMSMLLSLAKDEQLRFEHLGASVYLPSRWDRFLRRTNVRRFRRVERFRPSDYPPRSGISWTPDKGAVGEAWRKRKTVPKDLYALARKYSSEELTAEGAARLSAEAQAGFTPDDLISIVAKYSEVLAEPIWHGGKDRVLLGVLSIDRVFIDEGDTFVSRLDRKETLEITAATASTVGGILFPTVDET